MQAQLRQVASASVGTHEHRLPAPFNGRHETQGRSGRLPTWHSLPSGPRLVMCHSAIQHYNRSHLDDEFIAMQQALQQAMEPASGSSRSSPSHTQHAHHGAHVSTNNTNNTHVSHSSHSSHSHSRDSYDHYPRAAGTAATHTMSSLATHTSFDQAPAARVCSLGGPYDDPIITMQLLRAALREHSSCVLKIHGSQPSVLLDAVAMLHLLNQELGRGNGPHLAFKPLVVNRPRPPASPSAPYPLPPSSSSSATSPTATPSTDSVSPPAGASMAPAATTTTASAAAAAATIQQQSSHLSEAEEQHVARDTALLLLRIQDPSELLRPVVAHSISPHQTTNGPSSSGSSSSSSGNSSSSKSSSSSSNGGSSSSSGGGSSGRGVHEAPATVASAVASIVYASSDFSPSPSLQSPSAPASAPAPPPASSSSSSSPHASLSEAWQMAHALADRLQEERACVQLRCEGPRKLATALKALKRARRLLRHQAALDMLVAPQIISDPNGHKICFNCYPMEELAAVKLPTLGTY